MLKIRNKHGDICHIIIHKHEYDAIENRQDIISPENPLQLSIIPIKNQQEFAAHVHNPCEKLVTSTQECWVVVRGCVLVRYYDENGVYLDAQYLSEGSLSCTLKGGHWYQGCNDRTLVLEFKTGPYLGKEQDKTLL